MFSKKTFLHSKLFLFTALSCAALAASGQAQSQDRPALRAHLIGKAASPVLDGSLDDAAWRDAPVYQQFHEFLPQNGKPAPANARTTVQLLIDEHALIFGIRAWDADPSRLRGMLARRDKVESDQDFIGIWIDPSGHGRAAQFVRINTAGVISDGVYRADDDESDLGPDFPIDAAVKILPDGYSMEVRWPLASLRFPYADGKTWRAMVERSLPHADGMMLLSTNLKNDTLNYIAQLQDINGMGGTVNAVRDRGFLDIRPELTVRQSSERDADGLRRSKKGALGVEINARPRADWVFNATVNPDYSQVEIDAPTSSGANRLALSLPEKRGFFLESSDVLGLPLAAFYSRTVADPEWGLRATWRAAALDATAMSLRDQEGGLVLRGSPYQTAEFIQTQRSLATVLRVRSHGEGLLLGALVSQRDYGKAGANAVLGVDAQWRGTSAQGAQQQASLMLMHSQNNTGFDEQLPPVKIASRRGAYLSGKFNHRSSTWWNQLQIEAIEAGFVNDNGFVPQTGVVKTTLNLNRILGPGELPLPGATIPLYELEAHLGLVETRTLGDPLGGQPGKQIVERRFQPGFWLFAPRQTRLWMDLGFDQQRANREGSLHDVPALHFGFATTPTPWMTKLSAEFALGRQLDVDADRVGSGGNGQIDVGLRFGLARGWAVELDHHWNRAWVQGTTGHAAFADNGWRWLATLHWSARDSLRLLAQNTWAARRHDGVTLLDPWAERQIHRSLMYRHLWRHGRSMSLGYVRENTHGPRTGNNALTLKFQWEV